MTKTFEYKDKLNKKLKVTVKMTDKPLISVQINVHFFSQVLNRYVSSLIQKKFRDKHTAETFYNEITQETAVKYT